MTTIYTLAGLGTNYDLRNFGGTPFKGKTIKKIAYNNSHLALLSKPLALREAEKAVELIDDALHTPGYKEFWGHSKGGEMLEKWLRDKGPTSRVDPSSVKFYISGSPENLMGGVCHFETKKHPAAYGGLSIPENTPYSVTYIIRQYDYYADYPRDTRNELAIDNLRSGDIHSEYSKCNLNDDSNIVHIRGNVTYIFCPTPIMPLAKRWIYFGISSLQKREDAKLRPIVESAYDRTESL